jgi:hypothetical protein
MADVNINIKGTFEAKGGRMAGGGGGGGGGTMSGGGSPEGTFFDKLSKLFTQPLYDLMRVLGVSFREIAGVRLGVKAGQKMTGGGGKMAGAAAKGGGGMGGADAAAMAGTATMAVIAGALVVIAIVLKKIVDNSEVIQAALAMIDMILGSIYDMILMGIFLTADMLGIFEKVFVSMKEAYELARDKLWPIFVDLVDRVKWVGEKILYGVTKALEIKEALMDPLGLIKTGITTLLSVMSNIKQKLVDTYDYATGGFWTDISETFMEFKDKMVSGFIGGFNTVMDVTGIKDAFEKGKTVFEAISGLNFDGITGLAGKTWDGIQGLAGKAFDGIKGLAGLGYEKFTELFSIGVEPVQKFIDLFGLDFTGFTNLFSLDFSEAIEFIKKLTGNPLTGGSEGGGGAAGAGLFGVAGIVATNLW